MKTKGKKQYLFIILILGLIVIDKSYPILNEPLFSNRYSAVLYDKDDYLLCAKIADDGQWRFPSEEKTSLRFATALTLFEDKRFYYHKGIDIKAIIRAIYKNLKTMSVKSGGSTITMQVARLYCKNQPRTIGQKIYEIIISYLLEKKFSKDEILAMYASNAPFGGNVVGLETASWRYFGRKPPELSWAENCLLAVLPNSPALIHPGKNRSILRKKRDKLLDKLYLNNIIDMETLTLSKAENIPQKPVEFPQNGLHLLTRLLNETKNSGKNGRFEFRTTLSQNLQQAVLTILERYKNHLEGNNINNAAALVVEIESGRVLAYAGNYNPLKDNKNGNHVDVINSSRSSGSILKPFLYAAMLSSGEILPKALVADIPVKIGSYSPKNFNKGYVGAVSADRALAKSLNIPAIKMLQSYGVNRFIHLLRRVGLTTVNRSANNYGLSLILGGCEAKLFELTGIYASMARTLNNYNATGKYSKADFHPPVFFESDILRNLNYIENSSIFTASSIWFTFQSMLDVDRPSEESNWQMFSSGRKIAWKTGTSFGFRDGWAIGVSPDYAVGVWIGNASGEGRPELTGIKTAAPVLFDIFKLLPAPENWFSPPYEDMIYAEICSKSGYLASEICSETKNTLIPKNGIHFKKCPYHQLVHLDSTGKYQVNSDCEKPSLIQSVPWFILPPAMEFYYKSKNNSYKTLPPFRDDCKQMLLSNPNKVMEVIYPKTFTKIYVPKELDGTTGSTVFEVAHRKNGMTVFWHIDNKFVCQTKGFHHTALNPGPGIHTLTLVDEDGETLVIKFEILDIEKK